MMILKGMSTVKHFFHVNDAALARVLSQFANDLQAVISGSRSNILAR